MRNFIHAKRAKAMSLLLCLLCALPALAQTDYYYYRGGKVPLYRNENKVCISIPKEYDDVIERIRSSVWVMHTIRDDNFADFVMARLEYERLTKLPFWEEDSRHVLLNPDYIQGREEFVASPHISIKLKKEEDADLLASYAEQYKLITTYHSKYMPLWYLLAVTPESGMNTVDAGNMLYETGDFAETSPDLVALYYNFDDPFSPTEFNQGMAWVDGFGFEQDGGYKTRGVSLFYYTTAGDTLINGKQYFRIRRARCSMISYEGDFISSDDDLCFYLHEDGDGSVWLYTEDKDVFYELSGNTLYAWFADDLVGRDLYLYNTRSKYAAGGKIPLGYYVMEYADGPVVEGQYWNIHQFGVGSVSEVELLDGSKHELYDDSFISGIGPLSGGPLTGVGSPNSYGGRQRKFFALYRGGKLLYRNEGYLSALEEKVPDILGLVTGSSETPNALPSIGRASEQEERTYNLAGQQVDGKRLPRGLYIVGGKKVISTGQ